MERHHELTLQDRTDWQRTVRAGDVLVIRIQSEGNIVIRPRAGSGNRYRVEATGSGVDAAAYTTAE